MSKKIKVDSINIKIGDDLTKLTVEQAKELKDLLNELLGESKTVYLPSPPPVIIERPYRYWTMWAGTTTGTISDMSIPASTSITYALTG